MTNRTGHRSNNSKLTLTLLVVALVIALIVGAICGIVQFAKGADVPYNHISAELTVDKVYHDYDATTIKKALTVTGYPDETDVGGVTLGEDDYEVTFSDTLQAGSTVTITVTYLGGSCDSVVIPDVEIVEAKLTPSITIEGYSLVGNFYVDAEGYDAFVLGMDKKDVESRLSVTLVSDNPHAESIVKKFGSGVAWTDETSVPEKFGSETSNISERFDISLTVNIDEERTSSITETVNFNTLHPFALKLEGDWSQPANLQLTTTSTVGDIINTGCLDGKVYVVMNNGIRNSVALTPQNELLLSTMIGVSADALIKNEADYVYSKDVEIKYRSDSNVKPLLLPITGIKYVEPQVNIGMFTIPVEGYELSAVARAESVDIIPGNFSIQLMYLVNYSMVSTYVSLADFLSAGYKITNIVYYESTDSPATTELSTKITRISFECGGYTYNGPLFVDAIETPRPELPESVEMSENCSVQFSNFKMTDDINAEDIMVAAVTGGNAANAHINGDVISFDCGGKYTIEVNFKLGKDSDFRWSTGVGGGSFKDSSNTTVVYTVTVLGAELDLTLDFPSEIQYGEKEPNFNEIVSGKVDGSPSMNMQGLSARIEADSPLFDDDAPNMSLSTSPRYRVVYTGKYYVVNSDKTVSEVPYTNKYKFPAERGKYTVTIETEPTSYYKKAEATADFEIVQRQVSLQNATIDPKTFDVNVKHSEDDIVKFVTATGFASQHQDPDKKKEVISITFQAAAPTVTIDGVKYAYHANTYGVQIEIINPNYKWNDSKDIVDVTRTTDFVINAKRLNVSIGSVNIVYGDNAAVADITDDPTGWATINTQDAKYSGTDVNGKTYTDVTTAPINAGNYTVTYGVTYADGVDASDVEIYSNNVKSTSTSYTINRKSINRVSIDTANSGQTYKAVAYAFEIIGWEKETVTLTNGIEYKYSDILDVEFGGLLAYDNATKITTIKLDSVNGVISVIDAGTYSFEVSIKDKNFTWTDETDPVTAEAEIARQRLTFNLSDTEFEYDGNAHYPVLSVTNDTILAGGLTVELVKTYTYKDINGWHEIDESEITEADTYTITVSSFAIDKNIDGTDYKYTVNYVLGTDENGNTEMFVFDITAPDLIIPTLNRLSVVYNAADIKLIDLIDDDVSAEGNYYITASNGNPKVIFTIDGKEAVTVKNAGEYVITVTPTGNYRWADGKEDPTLTFTVIQRAIAINWNGVKLNHIYSNSKVVVSGYTVDAPDKDIDVNFTYEDENGVICDAINAGKYTVTAASLKETESSANYKIDYSNNDLYRVVAELVIAKREISVPAIDGSNTVEYGSAANQSFTLTVPSVKDFDWDNVISYSVKGSWKFGEENFGEHDPSSAAFTIAAAAANSGTLTFTHAGEYAVTFEIKDTQNYKWEKIDNVETDVKFYVTRKTVTAPALMTEDGTQRTIEYKAGKIQYPQALTVDGLELTYSFGENTSYDTTTPVAASEAYGLYFIKVSIKDDTANGIDHRNYMWVENEQDIDPTVSANNMGTLAQYGCNVWGRIDNLELETSVILHYAITKGILHVEYEVTDYLFGENGYKGAYVHVSGAISDYALPEGKTDAFRLKTDTDDYDIIKTNSGIESLAFYRFSDETAAKNGNSSTGELYTDLVGGLPWEAGWYGVSVTITVGDGSVYEAITGWYVLQVKPRPITVAWQDQDGKDSVYYNGLGQGLAANVTNVIYKNDETDAEKVIAPTLNVGIESAGDLPVNVGTVALTVFIDPDSANADNFTVIGGTNVTHSFTINQRPITVNVTSIDNKGYIGIYGNALVTDITAEYGADSLEFILDSEHTDLYAFINFELRCTDGSGVSGIPDAGSYKLIVAIKDEFKSNYILTADCGSADYTIEQRRITVTLNDNAHSEYGDRVPSTLSNIAYDVVWNNKNEADGQTDNDWLIGESDKLVFTLGTTADETKKVGLYPVTITRIDNVNYLIDFDETSTWQITNAEIGSVTVDTVNDVTYKGTPYSIVSELLKVGYKLKRDGVDENVRWFMFDAEGLMSAPEENAEGWIEITNETLVNHINKSYYFKITADNHNATVVETAHSIVINKAAATITPHFTIKYGEKSPLDVGYKTDLSDLLNSQYYTIDELVASDINKTAEQLGLEGSFGYLTDYEQGNSVKEGGYSLTFDKNTLVSTNYEFNNGEGVLTVAALHLTVEIKDAVNTYHQQYKEVVFVTTVQLPTSTYDNSSEIDITAELREHIMSGAYSGANVFELTTTAFDSNPTSETYTKYVGNDYDIIGKVTDDNYTATFSGSKGNKANHTINKATLDLTVEGYVGKKYNETEQALLSVSVKASDNSEIVYKYHVIEYVANALNASDLDWDNIDVVAAIPARIDVCRLLVYFCIEDENGNYVAEYGVEEVSIIPAENEFKFDGVFTDSAISGSSWVYGWIAEDNKDGYDLEKHAVIDPQSIFTRKDGVNGANTFIATLYKVGQGNALDELLTTNGTTLKTASDLIAEAWRQGLFDVGTYRLSVYMADTDNYTNDKINSSINFSVTSKKLTITADSIEDVTYGNAAPEYTWKISGYAIYKSDGTADSQERVFGADFNSHLFKSDYIIGREHGSVGTYSIYRYNQDGTVASGLNQIAETQNYTLEYVDSSFSVVARKVTILIEDFVNSYNLQGGETAATLTFTVANGTFYIGDDEHANDSGFKYNNGNQSIIQLRTLAISGYGATLDKATNNVIVAEKDPYYNRPSKFNAYPIYAIYGAYAKYGENDYNYSIEFSSGCTYNVNDGKLENYSVLGKDITVIADGDKPINGGAGSYTIVQASVSISSPRVYHLNENGEAVFDNLYSGAPNKVSVTVNGGNSEMIFTYTYKKTEMGSYGIIGENETTEAGFYEAHGRCDDDNYSAATFSYQFEIKKATVTVTAIPTWVEFGTELSGNPGDNNERFGGFDYEIDQGTLLSDIFEAYITNYPITYKVTDYDSSTDVLSSRSKIVPFCNNEQYAEGNILVVTNSADLDVIKRKVVVTVYGYFDTFNDETAQCDYLGAREATRSRLNEIYAANWAKFISVDDIGNAIKSKGLSALAKAITFALPESAVDGISGVIKANADGYGMNVSCTAANYDVRFRTADGDTVWENLPTEVNSTDDSAPRFVVNKAKLTITAQGYTVTYGDELSIADGHSTANDRINYAVSGTVNGEDFRSLIKHATPDYTVLKNGVPFKAWDSNVGDIYTVSVVPFDIVLDNYELDPNKGATYNTAELFISKRVITVGTENQMFQWDGSDNGGAWGISHEAVLTFADNRFVSNEANANINVAYNPQKRGGYTVSYNTKADPSITDPNYSQIAGAAPKIVGEYKVTITLNDGGNYVFENGSVAEVAFNVTPCIIEENNLRWEKGSIAWQDDPDFYGENEIANYINYVMQVVLFTFTPYGTTDSSRVPYDENGAINTYRFDGQKLALNANGRGRYEVSFELRASAKHNYTIQGNSLIVSSFLITSSTIDMTLSISDWIYNTTPNAPTATVQGAVNSNVKFDYARITDITNIDEFYGKGQLSDKQIESLKTGGYTSISSMTFNAGYYVVRAYYEGIVSGENGDESASETLYYVFRVFSAKVDIPTANADGYKFNGGEQSLVVSYQTNLIRVSYSGHTGTRNDGEDGIVVYATNKGTYEVTFTLVDDDNYEWNGEIGGTDAYVLKWIIAIDDSDNEQSDDEDKIISVGTIAPMTYGNVALDRSVVTIKDGYDGTLTTWFRKVGDTQDWTKGIPSNAGEYDLRLEWSDGDVNFSTKIAYAELTINPYEVEVTASGTVRYGDDWQNAVRYEGFGLYGHRVVGDAQYKLVKDNYGKLQVNGEYYVIVDLDNEGCNLTMSGENVNPDNYIIKAVAGRLTVTPRPLTVNIDSVSSQYGKEIILSNSLVTFGNNQLVDDIGELGLVLSTTAQSDQDGKHQPIGGYIITATVANTNYDVTINPGTYTITERRIRIELGVTNGIYLDRAAEAVIKSVYDENDSSVNIIDWVTSQGLQLTINYRGTVNAGAPYDDNVLPTLAGSYTATVRGSNNNNFIIVGEPFTTFVIAKKEIDGSLIEIANQTYTGKALTPVINDSEFAAEYGDGIYEVLDHSDFIHAGSYFVTLRINSEKFANYKWQSVEVAERNISFTIGKADNELIDDIKILGWTYSEYDSKINMPVAAVKFGQDTITFVYSNARDGVYNSGAPEMGNVGEYWVKVTVPATNDYNVFTSEPIKFAITKKSLAKPTLMIISDGEGKNDVYTGNQLTATINGYDMSLMNLSYDDINVSAGQIIARATNAGTYTIKLSIADTKNYCWQDADGNEIALTWIIAPKAIAKPTANTDKFMVNGQVLTYIPQGFDEDIMTISGNQTAYGGEFEVTIGLKDKDNYVWLDGGADDFTLTWNVVGINTVFIIVTSVIGGAGAIALIAICVQLILDHRRKRLIDLAIDARSQAEAMQTPSKPHINKNSEGGND